jgi:hypothetical protein
MSGMSLIAESRARAKQSGTGALPTQHHGVARGSLSRLRRPPSRSDLGEGASQPACARMLGFAVN